MKWNEFRSKIRGHIPFTNWWLVWNKINKESKTILDLGCGNGKPMLFINRHNNYLTTGVDIFAPYIELCKEKKTHNNLIIKDLRKLDFANDSFDIVISLQVMSEFTKEEGDKLIRDMIRIAKKQVLITADIGKFVYSGQDNNPYQVHKYVRSLSEFTCFGFKVYGMGIKGWGGETGVSRFFPKPLRWIINTFMQILIGGVMYYHPEWSQTVMLVLNKETEK